MHASYTKVAVRSLVVAAVGVFIVDYFSHLFFSNPMETLPYFLAKMVFYFVFSIIFLSVTDMAKAEFLKVVGGGILVSLLWGAYYNIFPAVLGYYPFGIALKGLSFLGMRTLGTGLAFGTVHILAFIVGYYSTKHIVRLFRSTL